MSNGPLVSIGVPAFNAAASVAATLEGLVSQSHQDLEILVSDNASTDDTARISEEIARGDRRVRTIRQPRNLGAQGNFRFLLSAARGAFFMWAGSDDVHQPHFVEMNLELLQTDPSLSGSVSQVRWRHGGIPGSLAAGTIPLLGTPRANLATLMRAARDNSRFYGLFRKEALLSSFPERDFHGYDIAVMAGTLRFGGHGRVEEVLLERERRDPAEYVHGLQSTSVTFPERLFPLGHFTRTVLTQNRGMLSPSALWWLTWRNVYEHSRYWATTDGIYGRVSRRAHGLLEPIRLKLWARHDSEPS